MEWQWSTAWDGRRRRLYSKFCLQCDKKFLVPKHYLSKTKACSTECSGLLRRNRISIKCALCYKAFERKPSAIKNAKASGLQFCTRKCKDDAQRIGGMREIQPPHYNSALAYRARAFREFAHKCASCGYSKTIKMMDVDHIDGNRENNNISNLQILCVWCHALKTRKVDYHMP